MVYDAIGNVLERHDARVAVDQRECFGYDARNRLIDAFTTVGACSAGPGSGGPAPYEQGFAYAPDGRITSRTDAAATIPYGYPSLPVSGTVLPLMGDWDGNGTATPGLYDPATNRFMGRNDFADGPPQFNAQFGTTGDVPLVGDWDGNGTDTIGVYRPSTRQFHGRNSLTGGSADISSGAFGTTTDVPITGDWDGSGTDTIGLFRPSTHEFFASNSFTAVVNLSAAFGAGTDDPLVGDWDGNGTDTVGVYRPDARAFYGRNSFTGGAAELSAVFGASGDAPLAGDWDGNGTDTIGAYRGAATAYHLRNTYTGGDADLSVTFHLPVAAHHPHAVATVGSDTYGYDANGNLIARPGSGQPQTLTWDAEHRLSAVAKGSATTHFVYAADGARLIRSTPASTTLYVDGHELTLTGSTLTTKRYYTLGSTVVAVRDSASGALGYLLGDQLGSTTVSVNASTGATQTQRFLPYGAPRSGSITATDRGWIGQTRDASTGLQYLNARYYDPAIGRFTAADPVVDPGQPGSLDRYGYGLGSPVTLSDPSGLWVPLGTDRRAGASHERWQLATTGARGTGSPTRVRLPGRHHSLPPKPHGVFVNYTGFERRSAWDLAYGFVQAPPQQGNGREVYLTGPGDCIAGMDGCQSRRAFLSESLLLDAYLRWREVDANLLHVGPLPEFFADASGVVADAAAYVEVGATGLSVIVPLSAPVTAPVGAVAGNVSAGASAVEFGLGVATGDSAHTRAGAFGMATFGFGRMIGATARGLNATAGQQRVVDFVTSFYATYGDVMVG